MWQGRGERYEVSAAITGGRTTASTHKGDKGVPNLARRVRAVSDGIACCLQRVERDDLFEKVEGAVAGCGVWKVRDLRVTRPRNDGCKQDSDEDSSADVVEHHEHGKDAAKVVRSRTTVGSLATATHPPTKIPSQTVGFCNTWERQ